MTPQQTRPGQRYHIPLFAELMLKDDMDEGLVRAAGKLAQRHRRIYDLMEAWYYDPRSHSVYEFALQRAVNQLHTTPWHTRMWWSVQWFIERVKG
jgi:hypothetical protein